MSDRRLGLTWPTSPQKTLLLVVTLLVSGYVVKQVMPPIRTGSWKSAEGKAKYVQAYEQTMSALPEPTSSQLVATRFGRVKVYVFEQPRRPERVPVLLIPGRSSGTPMWRENLPDLLRERSVIAFDALGDAGLSEQMRPIRNDSDQAEYVAELLAALGVQRAHVVGHSFGGWSAANFARTYPERVTSLSLLEPVFVVQGIKPEMWVKLSAMLLLQGVPVLGEKLTAWVTRDIGGSDHDADPTDPLAEMIGAGTRYYRSALPQPSQWTPQRLSDLHVPVFLALGAKSALHDSAAGAAVAWQAWPQAQVKVWPGGTHSLPMQFARALNRELLTFMRQHD